MGPLSSERTRWVLFVTAVRGKHFSWVKIQDRGPEESREGEKGYIFHRGGGFLSRHRVQQAFRNWERHKRDLAQEGTDQNVGSL